MDVSGNTRSRLVTLCKLGKDLCLLGGVVGISGIGSTQSKFWTWSKGMSYNSFK